jgi:hypothetical protein
VWVKCAGWWAAGFGHEGTKTEDCCACGGEAEAAAAPKVYTVAVGEKHAQVPKVGKAGDGKVVAGP